MGKIVAIGGGENGRSGTEYETEAIDREIISLTGKTQPRFLYVGLANTYPEAYYDVMCKIYRDMFGCKVEHLTKTDITDAQVASSKIANADIIYVGGGNTLRMMTLLRKYGIDAMLNRSRKQHGALRPERGRDMLVRFRQLRFKKIYKRQRTAYQSKRARIHPCAYVSSL